MPADSQVVTITAKIKCPTCNTDGSDKKGQLNTRATITCAHCGKSNVSRLWIQIIEIQ